MEETHIVRSYIIQNRLFYLMGVLFIAGANVAQVYFPRILGNFTDALQHGGLSTSAIAGYAGMLVGVGLTAVILMGFGRWINQIKGRQFEYELRQRLFRKWGTLSASYYQNHSIGDLLSHALSDVQVMRESVSMGINQSTNAIWLLVASLYMMIVHVDAKLTLISMAPMILIPFFVRWWGPKIRNQSRRSQEALGGMAQSVEESIGGIRTIKAFGNEDVILGRFARKVENLTEEKLKFVRLTAFFGSLLPLIGTVSFVIVFAYGGMLTIQKEITLGEFISFTMYVAMLANPLQQIGNVINLIQRSLASQRRLAEVLTVEPDVRDRDGELLNRPIRGDIHVSGLTYTYPGTNRKVLNDISFSVNRGRTLGIIGATGSGKTTLVNLLIRLYDPPEGTIFIDGEDIFRYKLNRLRSAVAYVPQDGFLFSTTLQENISFASLESDPQRVEQAARAAVIYDSIKRFSEGFLTEVGERGVRLSGGQKQRTAIARAIYKEASILIMDDSLSAVDTKTESLILKNLKDTNRLGERTARPSGRREQTTIIVSNRLSAVHHADEILVLDEGRLIERGNHQQLMKLGGMYARIYSMQAGLLEEVVE